MSSITNIWPSQLFDEPIPIVGIFIKLVICLARFDSTHSKTIENTPASSNILQSLINSFLSLIDFPLDLNFPYVDWGKIPRCPITGILFFIKCLIILIFFKPPSILRPSHFVNFITFLQFFNAWDGLL